VLWSRFIRANTISSRVQAGRLYRYSADGEIDQFREIGDQE
jgi:hypothetical protein